MLLTTPHFFLFREVFGNHPWITPWRASRVRNSRVLPCSDKEIALQKLRSFYYREASFYFREVVFRKICHSFFIPGSWVQNPVFFWEVTVVGPLKVTDSPLLKRLTRGMTGPNFGGVGWRIKETRSGLHILSLSFLRVFDVTLTCFRRLNGSCACICSRARMFMHMFTRMFMHMFTRMFMHMFTRMVMHMFFV